MPPWRAEQPRREGNLDRAGQGHELRPHRHGLGQMLHVGLWRDEMGDTGNRQEDRQADSRAIADEPHPPKANRMACGAPQGNAARSFSIDP